MSTLPLGYITPAQRTADMDRAHERAVAAMPAFRFATAPRRYAAGEFVSLMDLWKDPRVVAALGFAYPGTHQVTGSCVGAGGGNALFSLAAVEVLRLGDRERIVLPFWPYPYGISRELLGEAGEGEGSLGSTFAEAVRTLGVLDNAEAQLPKPQNTDGLVWGERVEMQWSNGRAIPPAWRELGRKHLVRSTAPVRSGQEAFDAVMNGYPVTFACNNFVNPGSEQAAGDAVVGTLGGRGGHQTSLQAAWNHPSLGPLVWNQNQWGLKVYKPDPRTGLGCGCWMKVSEVDRALRSLDAEVFAFSQFDGFPAQTPASWADILP